MLVQASMRYLSIMDFVLDHRKSQIRRNLQESKKGNAQASYSHQKERKSEGLTTEAVFDKYHDYGLFLIHLISTT